MYAPLTIPEKDEPLLKFSLRTLLTNGQQQIDDLTGATVQWISKLNKLTSDASGTTISGSILNPSTDPVAQIQITAAVTQTAGLFYYKVVVTLNTHPLTYRHGPLTIAST
jgi:hypothetical protein